ncbi:DNA (cytosine-5-)-methyltransferase [Isoptericola variabilis]|uniref:Cytosine-specific methyltransferase n=1 Tax=Isoptericola variabilis (strain 225) TaxID=743718 RepID=F6FRN8_ISOV2|nr:DNA (cytosine-5-)-methyltransferase [Isoptericola variabilis]AEG42979.1 DNA-cytosine methyltransferase [Isoptericola variabilis 225]TWH30050.1 DNA (cytosine-5)-methyltransferase 1 [Isoptericola variabilis J7]
MTSAPFRYVDLFAGIGGFHAVLDAMGGECVYAVEIDAEARRVYEANWGLSARGNNDKGDITLDTSGDEVNVPEHDVLVAGFPCQPFSKSGAQKGMEEARGTLFFDIMRVVEDRRPSIVLLENVRNLAGPRHIHEWEVIIKTLRQAGYRVSHKAAIFSPAMIAPEFGGHPQTRERVFIAATRINPEHRSDVYRQRRAAGTLKLPSPFEDVEPISLDHLRMRGEWNLRKHLPLIDREDVPGTKVADHEWKWIEHWDLWLHKTREMLAAEADAAGRRAREIPGFPIWAHVWTTDAKKRKRLLDEASSMAWKVSHLNKNFDLFDRLCAYDLAWTEEWLAQTKKFPESRQKFEWQAQDAPSVHDCVISLRPSGLRVKRMTHLPALVAISQTPIIGPLKRRLSVIEGARLQGLPDGFDWAGQKDAATWKQLGNGVNTGVVAQALAAQVERDAWLLELDVRGQAILDAVRKTMAETGGDLRTKIREAMERGQARARAVPAH